MILGHGDIAQAIKESGIDRDDILYFASGVSNSRCVDARQFEREYKLFNEQDFRKQIIYFSSLCVYTSGHRYAVHKQIMEGLVRTSPKNTLVRIGNIAWGSNPNTIINHFKHCYNKGIQPNLKDVYRHIVSKGEFIYWLKLIRPGINDIMNIPGEMIHVKEIWRRVTNGEY
jgi:hypothetical protein